MLVVLRGVGGAAVPPVSASDPAAAGRLIIGDDEDVLATAYAFDAIVIEVGFVTGPLIGSLIIAVASPAAGARGDDRLRRRRARSCSPARRRRAPGAPSTATSHRRSALRAPGLRTLVLATLAVGVMFGSLEVGAAGIRGRPGQGPRGGAS